MRRQRESLSFRSTRARVCIAACAALLTACSAVAQQAPPPPESESQADVATLRVATRTVEIATVVRNKAGEPQNAIAKDDFLLKVDGKEQPLQHFSVAADLPLTLALIVDVSGSQRTLITDEWRASDIFFQSMLTRPQDRAMLVEVDARVLQLMPMTNSVPRLHLALTQLGEHGSDAAATLLNESVFYVSREKLAKEAGRKAIVLLTDGGDNGSRVTLAQAIEQAQRANVAVYAVDYSVLALPQMVGLNRVGGSQLDPGEALLKKLAESTGGRVYTVSHTMSLHRIFEQIESDLRTQYELGYRPPADLKPNSFHKLEVRVRTKGLSVQARNGFYVQP